VSDIQGERFEMRLIRTVGEAHEDAKERASQKDEGMQEPRLHREQVFQKAMNSKEKQEGTRNQEAVYGSGSLKYVLNIDSGCNPVSLITS
jgi:hypothetical protein